MSTYLKDYVVDVLRIKGTNPTGILPLKEIFEDQKFIKIFHGCDSDL